jgi:hypothetical protein
VPGRQSASRWSSGGEPGELDRDGGAAQLYISEAAVEQHVRSILAKLDLPATDEDHRRMLAVLLFLDAS